MNKRTVAAPAPICVECAHHESRVSTLPGTGTMHECYGIRNIVTGVRAVTQCSTARGKKGACGTAGKLYAAKVWEAAE